MNRLQKQLRGLLEEIEVGDWISYEQFPALKPVKVQSTKGDRFIILRGSTEYISPKRVRHATPQELLDHGIIDEIAVPAEPFTD